MERAVGAIVECRNFGAKLEVRDAGAGARPRLAGYAAKFNKLSRPLGTMRFREKIDPHAFDETLASRPDVRFTLNHDPNYVMGRTGAGTLKLYADRVGLGFDLDCRIPRKAVTWSCRSSVAISPIARFRSGRSRTLGARTRTAIRFARSKRFRCTTATSPRSRIRPIPIPKSTRARSRRSKSAAASSGNPHRAEMDREIERELDACEVKVGPSTPLLYGYATVYHRYGANVRNGARATRATVCCGAHSRSPSRAI